MPLYVNPVPYLVASKRMLTGFTVKAPTTPTTLALIPILRIAVTSGVPNVKLGVELGSTTKQVHPERVSSFPPTYQVLLLVGPLEGVVPVRVGVASDDIVIPNPPLILLSN